jgi:hypothetical protein
VSWAASGARREARREARPVGSWGASIERARAAWDGLTGGPSVESATGRKVYSDRAAASILSTAVALWADTAAGMGES